MRLLSYCLLCLFVMRVQLKPQITKLFSLEELMAYHRQASNTTKSLDKFFEKLRATYNYVFRQPNNTGNVEKILVKGAPNPDLQALKLIWVNQIKLDNYTDLKYPNDSFLDHVKSLSVLKDYQTKVNTSSLEKKDSTVEIKSMIRLNGNNMNFANFSGNRPNKTKTLNDDEWLNDIQPLGQLELQNEDPDKKTEVEIVTPGTTLQFPTIVGRHLVEWLGSLFGATYNIYTKLTGAACSDQKAKQ